MNNNIVDEIKSRCDIVDVVGQYVKLKRAGSIYKGLCPFHNEKTPSFAVYQSKQFYNCYGCGEAGDLISFVMKIENLDFRSAVAKLAEQYGIDMDKFGFRNESKNSVLYDLNREAARFFFHNMTAQANPGLTYMTKRSLDPKTITKFGIGYASDSWDGLLKHLQEAGYSPEQMLEAGLVSYKKETNRYYDKFRNRVIFPILNTRGKVIGFGGRDLGTIGPKYLNSPESPVFSKKNNLYGLNLTRHEINKSNCAIIVEGYMDLVSLYKHGITNVAASLGTALTENQCRLLKRYTENVILSYDADAAGQKAALRGIQLLHQAGIHAKVLHISDGKDPDEFVKKHGKDAFLKLLDEALPYAEYRISVIRKNHDIATPSGVVQFLREISGFLAELSPVEAEVYIKKIALETGISEGAIRREVNRNKNGSSANMISNRTAQPKTRHYNEPSVEKSTPISGNISLQKNLLRILATNPEYLERVRDYEEIFCDAVFMNIYRMMKTMYYEEEALDLKKVMDSLEPQESTVFQDILENIPFPVNSEQQIKELLSRVKGERLQIRYQHLLQSLEMLSDEETDKIKSLTEELIHIQSELQKYKLN